MVMSRGLRPISLLSIASRSSASINYSSARQISHSIRSTHKSYGLRMQNGSLLQQGGSFKRGSLAPCATIGAVTGARRLQSTVNTPNIPQAPTLPPADDITNIDFGSEIANLPEQIGYLKELGLDFGWGPTSIMQWSLEHIHVYSGLPWWASIIVTSIALRLTLAKPYMDASEMAARTSAMKSVLDPIKAKMTEAMRKNDTEGAMAARAMLVSVHKQSGISTAKALVGPLLNGVTGFAMFRLIRNMASLPVPGLETGGLLWITDLTISDPYYIFPVASGLMFHLVAKYGGEAGANANLSDMQKKLMTVYLPVLAPVFTCWLPSGLQLYFFFNSTLSFGQAYLLRQKGIRDALGLSPIIRPTRTVAAGSASMPTTIKTTARTVHEGSSEDIKKKPMFQRIVDGAKSDMSAAVKGFKETVAQATGDTSLTAEAKKGSAEREAFLKSAEAYEQRRRAEIERAKKFNQR